MSPDLKLATVYVMPLGGKAQEQIVAILDRHKKYLRGEVAHRVNLKYAPEIRFKVDESFANAARIDALLHSPKVAQDLPRAPDHDARRRRGRAVNAPRSTRVEVNGWVVLDKPVGLTSTQAVSKLKRLFNAKKAGHAGTLDPLASGVLPIAFGEATKTVPFVQDGEKAYRFTVQWGVETDTDDAEGHAVADQRRAPGPGGHRGAAAALHRRDHAAAAGLFGDQDQWRARL